MVNLRGIYNSDKWSGILDRLIKVKKFTKKIGLIFVGC